MTTVRIVADRYPSNPRTESDNFCLMVCAHGRYNLGDENATTILAEKLNVSAREYSASELVGMAHERGLVFASKPLYLYDHSGITMATTPFSCHFDSGQVGEILVFKDDIRSDFGVKRIGKKIHAKMIESAERHIDGEVSAYDSYLTGDMYCLEIRDDNGEVEDCIAGFIGTDFNTNGMLDFIDESMIEQLREGEVSYA